jgi:hypothetical protein
MPQRCCLKKDREIASLLTYRVVRRHLFKKAAEGKNELPECERCQILIFDCRATGVAVSC